MPTWRRSGRTGCRRAGPLSVRGPRNRRRAAHGVGRRDIRVVEKPCDTAETLRLALREIAVLGAVKAREARVLFGLDADDGLQREGFRNVGDGQRIFGRQKWHFLAVDRNTQCFQVIAIQHQRLCGNGRIAAHRQRRGDGRAAGFNDEIEVNGIDQERGRGVVLEIDRLGGIGFHCGVLLQRKRLLGQIRLENLSRKSGS